jgi:hypothetical protein
VTAFTPSPAPTDGTTVTYMGCFVGYDTTLYPDSTNNRYIGENSTVFDTTNSHQACYNYCSSSSKYRYFALEFGKNCRCSVNLGSQNAQNTTGCSTPASGASTEAAGGQNRITAYQINAGTGNTGNNNVRPLSNCSLLKSSALCKHFFLSLQGKYQASTTALRPSHSITNGRTRNHDIHDTHRHKQFTSASDRFRRFNQKLEGHNIVSTPPIQMRTSDHTQGH